MYWRGNESYMRPRRLTVKVKGTRHPCIGEEMRIRVESNAGRKNLETTEKGNGGGQNDVKGRAKNVTGKFAERKEGLIAAQGMHLRYFLRHRGDQVTVALFFAGQIADRRNVFWQDFAELRPHGLRAIDDQGGAQLFQTARQQGPFAALAAHSLDLGAIGGNDFLGSGTHFFI